MSTWSLNKSFGGIEIFHEESETSQVEARLKERTMLILATGRTLASLEIKYSLRVNVCLPCGAEEDWTPWFFVMGEYQCVWLTRRQMLIVMMTIGLGTGTSRKA